MGIFYLKQRDTRPILVAELHDPPPLGSPVGTIGAVHDLTGSTGWKLHIWLEDGTRLVRTMVPDGTLTSGILRYTWIATDWDAPSSLDADGAYQVGGLVIGPTIPLARGRTEHRMEYEVVGPSTARLTFPNDGYDVLRITDDIGQG